MSVNKRVLVVDGDPGVRAAVELTLYPSYDVVGAATGAAAMAKLAEGPFAHVFLDCVLPDARPADIVRAARTRQADLDIVLTGAGEETGPIAEAFRAGVRGFLRKPFGASELRSAVAAGETAPLRTLGEMATLLAAEGYPLARAKQFLSLHLRDTARRFH